MDQDNLLEERSEQDSFTQHSKFFKKSQRVSYKEFKELFSFEENERDKKQLKKDFKRMEKKNSGKVKFKHLLGNSICHAKPHLQITISHRVPSLEKP